MTPSLNQEDSSEQSSSNITDNAVISAPTPIHQKLGGYEFFRTVLKSPKYIVAPMVDQSEYAWRELSRKYNADLCYTPMYHARLFVEHPKYKNEVWQTGPEDRPLIAQFCANDPQHLLDAAKLIEDECDAVDLNLGCPQNIARRGHYGAFLQDEWPLIAEMISKLHKNLKVPVTVKIRVFDDLEKTLEYAKMIEAAGCQVLTVHGRTREQKGHESGLADWDKIKAIKEALSIPVIANGNILYYEDIQKCIDYTGVDAVMSAETNLANPALFSDKHYAIWRLAEEYLEIVREKPNSAHIGMIKAHIFRLFHTCLSDFTDIRDKLSDVHNLTDVENVVKELKSRLMEMAGDTVVNGEYVGPVTVDEDGYKILPVWVAQPKIRRSKPETIDASEDPNTAAKRGTDAKDDENPRPKRVKVKPPIVPRRLVSCVQCNNVSSQMCPMSLCKPCCRKDGRKVASERGLPDIHQNGRAFVCFTHKVYKLAKKDWERQKQEKQAEQQ